MKFKWQELDEDQWQELLETIDPDWTDHFADPEHGLTVYSKHSPDLVENALKEYQQ